MQYYICMCDLGWEPVVVNLGHCYRKQQRWDDAVQVYERALGLCPGQAGTYAALGFTRHLKVISHVLLKCGVDLQLASCDFCLVWSSICIAAEKHPHPSHDATFKFMSRKVLQKCPWSLLPPVLLFAAGVNAVCFAMAQMP